ncbi:SDR family oxidoreductase [Streptomyces sp. NPDC012794]|uniref:SDR family oxidoreductase n=1 Tax=Streptomyces sp. NPDC012794 TaxID=3364850 RepID=UPI0036ABDDDA
MGSAGPPPLERAEHGARVVLAARGPPARRQVARSCGPGALVVPTDVTDERAVEAPAAAAVGAFGRVDLWIDAAAAGIPGRSSTS